MFLEGTSICLLWKQGLRSSGLHSYDSQGCIPGHQEPNMGLWSHTRSGISVGSSGCNPQLRELLVSPLSWSDHALITMGFFGSNMHCREAGSITLIHPWWLMDPVEFLWELRVVPIGLLHSPSKPYFPLGIKGQLRFWIRSWVWDLSPFTELITPHGLQRSWERWNGRRDV